MQYILKLTACQHHKLLKLYSNTDLGYSLG